MTLTAMVDEYDPAPNKFREQHEDIVRSKLQIRDSNDAIGAPWVVKGLLARLEASKAIGAPERLAGEHFRDEFARAGLDPLRALDMGKLPGGSHPGHCGNVRAQQRVWEALKALGGISSPMGSCAWFVLGCENSVREWAMREGWNGKPLNQQRAAGLLIGALGVLRAHFDGERR